MERIAENRADVFVRGKSGILEFVASKLEAGGRKTG